MILLTGSTGFIGRHVLSLLLERGDTVVTFGRSAPAPRAGGKLLSDGCLLLEKTPEPNSVAVERTRQVESLKGPESESTQPTTINNQPTTNNRASGAHRHITGDLATGDNLDQLPWAEITHVIHLAAAGVKASRRAWPEALAVNVVGTQRLLAAVSTAPLHPRVFIARTFYEDLVEQSPALLDNPYIATKHAATQLARLFAKSYCGGLVFGSFFQVYGPGDDPGNVLSYAAREFQAGRTPVFGSGKSLRDWIYITDAASAVLACLAASPADYDIGTGKLFPIRDMVEGLHRVCPEAPSPIFDPRRDRPDTAITACAQNLPPAWAPQIPAAAGLADLLASA